MRHLERALRAGRIAAIALAITVFVGGAAVAGAEELPARARSATADRSSAATQTVEAVPGPASASIPATPTILSPANGLRTRSYVVNVIVDISRDTTRVSLRTRGAVLASFETSGASYVIFRKVRLRLGWNSLYAAAANAAGGRNSADSRIKVVGAVGAARLSGVFYRRVFYGRLPSIAGVAGRNTNVIVAYVNGRRARTVRVGSSRRFTLRRLPLRYGANRLIVYASNECYRRRISTIVYRLDIRPAFTTLVLVDKSERHIYYIRNRKLMVRYPCAIGKPSTPTPERVWRIDSKEYTDPGSVYGPRKLRLFSRQRGRRGYWYKYTNYGIHGTDTPSSIGRMASHGCIRLYNRDIRRLFSMVRLRTMVVTRR